MEWAFWFADEEVSCLILRVVIMLKPILHTLMVKLGDEDAIHEPFQLATQSLRVISDTYNDILASAGVNNNVIVIARLLTRVHRSAVVCSHPAGKEGVGGRHCGEDSRSTSYQDLHCLKLRKPR